MIDLDRFTDKPEEFLKYIQWSKNGAESSYFIDIPDTGVPIGGSLNIKKPFLSAPEWVMNNFYLLDLGPAYIDGEYKEHVTPFMLFESEAKNSTGSLLVNGPGYVTTNFWRYKH